MVGTLIQDKRIPPEMNPREPRVLKDCGLDAERMGLCVKSKQVYWNTYNARKLVGPHN